MQQSEANLELEAPQSSPVKPFAAKLDNALLQGTAKSGDRPIRQHTEAHPELKAVLGQSVSSSNKVLASYRPLFQSCQCIHSPEFRMQSLKSFANERSHPAMRAKPTFDSFTVQLHGYYKLHCACLGHFYPELQHLCIFPGQ